MVIVLGHWSAAGPGSGGTTLWGPLTFNHCSGPPVLGQRVLALGSALEGCEPVESSSSPSLWTAAQLQPQEAGVIQRAPDAVAQWGREGRSCRPRAVGGGDIFPAMLEFQHSGDRGLGSRSAWFIEHLPEQPSLGSEVNHQNQKAGEDVI